MSKIRLVATAAALFLSLSAIADGAERLEGQAKKLDQRAFPNLTLIYVASGVRDNGGAAFVGVAASIHCTNWTAGAEQVRFLVRDYDGALVENKTVAIGALDTITASTHDTRAYDDDLFLSPGVVIRQGSVRVFATAAAITCTAQVIDASTVAPLGVDLHLVRHNPWPGTQE